MAKLSARGRTTLVEVSKTYPPKDGIIITTFKRYMSDRVILRKDSVAYEDPSRRPYCSGWTVVDKNCEHDALNWAGIKKACGYTIAHIEIVANKSTY